MSSELLWQYLFEGDFLGFITACYTLTMGQYFYGVLAVLFTSPIYIRTGSLLLLCIIWILIGGIVINAMPMLSGVAMLLLVLGLGGAFWEIFQAVRK